MFKKVLRLGMLAVLAVVVAAGAGWSDVPMILNIQARITTGNPPVPASAGSSFSSIAYIYDTGGNKLAEVGIVNNGTGISDANGVVSFNYDLSKATALDFSKPYYVAIQIGSGAESTARQQLTAAPYAITAKNVYGGTGYFSGNVGIGTTVPFSPLEVQKLSAGAAVPATSGAADPTVVSRFHYGSIGLDLGVMDNGTSYIQNRVYNNCASNYSLLINPNGGNVGIGTTAPQSALHIAGTITTPDSVIFQHYNPTYTNGSSQIRPYLSKTYNPTLGDYLYLGASGYVNNTAQTAMMLSGHGGTSTNAVQFGLGSDNGASISTPWLTITTAGYVGIGMTNPTQKLVVNGTVTATNFLKADGSPISGSNTGWFHTTYNTATIPASDTGGGLTIGWNRLLNGAGYAEVDLYNVYDNATNSFLFSQKTGATTFRDLMTITGAGYVGIGTTAPAAPLHVKGSMVLDDKLNNALGNSAIYGASDASEHGGFLSLYNSTGYASSWGLKAGGILVSDDYNYATVPRSMLIVKNSVCIGAPAPSSRPLTVTNTASGNGSGLGIDWNRTQGGGETNFYNYGQGGPGGFSFLNYYKNQGTYATSVTPTQLMALDSSGNMTVAGNVTAANFLKPDGTVIGGGSNTSWFHTTYNTAAIPASDNSNGGLTIGWNRLNGGAGYAEVDLYNVYDNATNSFLFSQKTGATTFRDLMTITSAGNVGIGLTNPGAFANSRLEVAGPATGSGATIHAGGGGDVLLASYGSLFFDNNYSYASGNYIRPVSSNTQAFFTSGVERMRITSGGLVGIGTSPNYTLDVNGTLHVASSAYVGGWLGVGPGTPRAVLDVSGSQGGGGLLVSCQNIYSTSTNNLAMLKNTGNVMIGWNRSGGAGETDFFANRGGGSQGGFYFYDLDNAGNLTDLVNIYGTATPRMYVNGYLQATNVSYSSDRRWKKNITPLENSLQKVCQLQGVNYEWRIKEFPDKGFTDTPQIGLIAQDVEKVIPQLVSADKDGFKSLDYGRLTAVLVEAVKDQQAQIKELKAKLAEVEKKLGKQ
jgi:hypothetical protein